MSKKYIILLSIVLFLLSSCVTRRKTEYFQNPSGKIPDYEQVGMPEDYRLQVGDAVNVHVYSLSSEVNSYFNKGGNGGGSNGGGSLTSLTTYTIQSDSCIYYPVLGNIKLAGKTLRESSVLVRDRLKDGVVIEDITVQVTLVNNACYIVMEGGSSMFMLPSRQTTIYQVLGIAREINDFSDRAHIKIMRQMPDGQVLLREFDLRSKSLLNSEFYYVQPNDVIYIHNFKGQFFRISSFSSLLSTILSVVGLGLTVYGLTKWVK